MALSVLRAGSGADTEPRLPAYAPNRIAVLYFDDLSPDDSLAYLAAGLTNDLIARLDKVEALEVVPLSGVKAYRRGDVALDTIIHDLQVGSIVEGTVQEADGVVRVRVHLTDANRKTQLENAVVEERVGNLFTLQDAVTERVEEFLRRRLGREFRLREMRAATSSSEAYGLVLRTEQIRSEASFVLRERDSRDSLSAVRLLLGADTLAAKAERLDPDWPEPTLLRGWIAADRAQLASGKIEIALLDTARAYAERVLRRESRNAEAMELRGTALWRAVLASGADVADPRVGLAEQDLRRAGALESRASAWSTLSQLLRVRGAFAEAVVAAKRALAEDAYLEDADRVIDRLFRSEMMLAHYRESGEWCDEGRRRFPGEWRFVECRLTLLREDPQAVPDPALAWRLVAQADSLDPPALARAAGHAYQPVYRRMVAATVSARAGDTIRARAVLATALRQARGDVEVRTDLMYDEAYLRLALGETDAARRLFDEFLNLQPTYRELLDRDPLMRELNAARGTPPAR
jgi:TolB-like protein/tetratricopeptide (TPR) repeat protein